MSLTRFRLFSFGLFTYNPFSAYTAPHQPQLRNQLGLSLFQYVLEMQQHRLKNESAPMQEKETPNFCFFSSSLWKYRSGGRWRPSFSSLERQLF